MKIYGPYKRKDGREHVCIVHDDGKKQTKSYPRFLLEKHLGRELLSEETVDHIDEDFTNNQISNLRILSRSENAAVYMLNKPGETYRFICPYCGKESVKRMNQVKANWKKGKAGPFCSRACAGKSTYKNPWVNQELAK